MNVEFVSANPTGPITVASARHAAYGDALCRILEFAGNEVDREYYVNDHGGQIQRFAESIRARATGEEPPEDGYRGDYVTDLARQIDGAAQLDDEELAQPRGRADAGGRASHARALPGAHGPVRLRAGALRRRPRGTAALDSLEEREHVYPLDGAVWLRSTTFGDDKDRVLMRTNGEFTYLAADIANHEAKRERGYDRCIDVWGADHHGYVGAPARRLAGAGRRARPPGAADHAAGQPPRGRTTRPDVEA